MWELFVKEIRMLYRKMKKNIDILLLVIWLMKLIFMVFSIFFRLLVNIWNKIKVRINVSRKVVGSIMVLGVLIIFCNIVEIVGLNFVVVIKLNRKEMVVSIVLMIL